MSSLLPVVVEPMLPLLDDPVPLPSSVPEVMLLVVTLCAVVDAPSSAVVFELPVPLPPDTLVEPCEPVAVLAVFALPVPSPPPVAEPAAEPLVPVVPAPEPSVSVPVPAVLVVVPVVDALTDDVPPAPSVVLKPPPPPLPLLDTSAALPAAPPLSAEFDALDVALLSPEFSLDCELAEP